MIWIGGALRGGCLLHACAALRPCASQSCAGACAVRCVLVGPQQHSIISCGRGLISPSHVCSLSSFIYFSSIINILYTIATQLQTLRRHHGYLTPIHIQTHKLIQACRSHITSQYTAWQHMYIISFPLLLCGLLEVLCPTLSFVYWLQFQEQTPM